MYRRSYRTSKPKPRTIKVKYAGNCVCCGATIAAGEIAAYYPVGTIAGITAGKIAHIGGLDGKGGKCAANNYGRKVDVGLNDYAGDGLDARYEDNCRETCGL